MLLKDKEGLARLGDFVKVAVDIERGAVAAGCELHIDCAEELIKDGSESKNIWGANVYPQESKIDYVSLLNIRPHAGNRSMEIQLPEVKAKVEEILRKFL
ncbi:MAG: DUF5674 family protein [Patescibacteria group bacterium]